MSWRHERKRYRELHHCDTNAMYCSSKPAAESAVTSHIVCMPSGYTAILKYPLLLICQHRKVKTARCSSYLQIPRADNSLKQVIILGLTKRFTCQRSEGNLVKMQRLVVSPSYNCHLSCICPSCPSSDCHCQRRCCHVYFVLQLSAPYGEFKYFPKLSLSNYV